MDINTKTKEKACGNSLKHQVREVWRRKVLDASPPSLLPAGQMPEGRRSAFVNHIYADLYRNLFTPVPYLRRKEQQCAGTCSATRQRIGFAGSMGWRHFGHLV